ncbi:MAG: PHP domain-containing protein [Cyanobacteriota bacterium]|nr:PHP domain-containing protein [Cyanobacteriota bacterium]
MLELHCHTTCSDGTLTPTELVQLAVQSGVRVLAITDHDTLSGWSEALDAAQTHPLEIVPGVELSTVHNERSLHVLGFYPNPDKLNAPLRKRLEGRKRRARAMADKLAALGYPIQLPQLGEGMAPGRPHIAKALLAAGHVSSMPEAFDRWLYDGGPAYVAYEKFSAVDGIRLLRDCDAVPVWAHPYLFRGGEVEKVLPELIEAGLMGIEVYHPSHRPTQVANLEKLCQDYGLLKTGGSDYHGPNPGIRGKGDTHLNQLNLPLDLLPPLVEAANDQGRIANNQ